MNLLIVGASDPANIRGALLGLEGDRSAFGLPQVAPFDCTWADAAAGWRRAGGDLQRPARGAAGAHHRTSGSRERTRGHPE